HECAHGVASALLGQPSQEMELTPLGAVLRLEDEERLPPLRRFVMLAAGPAMTLLLCALSLHLTRTGVLPISLGKRVFAANLALLLLNLLPALPLDGGRMLSLLLGRFLRADAVARIMRTTGTLLGVAAIVLSVCLAWQQGSMNLSLASAGCFLMYTAAQATTTQALHELRRLMDRKITLEGRGFAPVWRMAVMADQPLHRVVRLVHPSKVTEFVVMERGTMRVLGVLTEAEAIGGWLDSPQMRCGEGMKGTL
ncbi:MAG: hypothetical protein IJ343_12255, partial [Clostridia bacterium]|nr:hypothetical protein [Clostridia bacterium]